jgi:DNA-binding NtrC family response regulator
VLELAQHFLSFHAASSGKPVLRLSAEVAKRLTEYRWPGNVRELQNCIARAVAFAQFDEVTVDDLPERIRSFRSDRFVISVDDDQEIASLVEMERRYVKKVMELFNGNKTRAAQALGIDRRTLYRKAEKWAHEEDGPRDRPPIES